MREFKYEIKGEGCYEFEDPRELAYDIIETCYARPHMDSPEFLPGDDITITDKEGREWTGETGFTDFCDSWGLWEIED